MPNVIIYWPAENLPVTMIIYNLIGRTCHRVFASVIRKYAKSEQALPVYSNGLILVSL